SAKLPVWSFAIVGAGASFLSALLGSVGPIMAPFFLAYGLVKSAYIGTEALSTVVMHVFKLVAYHHSSILPGNAVLAGLAIGPVMILGSWLGKKVVDRLPEKVFVWIIEATLLIAGIGFLWKG
ncbi:MAG: TSUP family transporter, partial [Acidobacteriaceae bacterium]